MNVQQRMTSESSEFGFDEPALTTSTAIEIGSANTASSTPGVIVPESQTYYWTPEWQRNEAEAVEEIRSGEARRFASTDDAIRWLLSAED
jgi:hypothetical protein